VRLFGLENFTVDEEFEHLIERNVIHYGEVCSLVRWNKDISQPLFQQYVIDFETELIQEKERLALKEEKLVLLKQVVQKQQNP
jgi:hypothetical protein